MIWHCLAEINKTYLKNGAALAVYVSPKPAYIYLNCVLITSRKNMVHIAVSGFSFFFFLNGSMLTSIFGCTTSWLYWKCFFKSLPKHIQWYPLQNVIFNISLSLSFLILLYDLYHGRRWDIQILKQKKFSNCWSKCLLSLHRVLDPSPVFILNTQTLWEHLLCCLLITNLCELWDIPSVFKK